MKVFFLPRWFPVPDDPLWGLFVLRHAQAVNRYAEVFVIYVDKTAKPELYTRPLFTTLNGIPVLYHYYKASRLPLAGKLLMTFRMLLAWHRAWQLAVKQWGKPDINHVHILTRMGIFAGLIRVLFRVPYVITEHWSRYLPQNMFYRGCLRRFFTRIVVRGAGAVMPVTNNLAEAMQGMGLKNPHYSVVPNAVDVQSFRKLEPPNSPGKFTILHISTFDERAKNISGILKVVAKLVENQHDFLLRMVGDGAGMKPARALADSLGLTDEHLRFEGALEPDAIPGVLASAHLLLLFSHYENMPVVINEALVTGVPVLATSVGGIPEVINQTNGVLVPPGDENALYEALAGILESGATGYNREEIRKDAEQMFSMEKVGNDIYQQYQMVIKAKPYV